MQIYILYTRAKYFLAGQQYNHFLDGENKQFYSANRYGQVQNKYGTNSSVYLARNV
jgi:hypothetical protein